MEYWLKNRALPEVKREHWKQENTEELTEFENAMLHIGGSFFGEHAGLNPNNTAVVKEQANLLLTFAPRHERYKWSEEDENNLNWVVNVLDQLCRGDDVQITTNQLEFHENWLKSIKFQNTWKPSENQIKAIEFMIRSFGESGTLSPYGETLAFATSLLNDLKKL